MHRVAVVVSDRSALLDVAIPAQVFGTARASEKAEGEFWGPALYDVIVCAERPGTTLWGPGGLEMFQIAAPYTLDDARTADTIIVPGGYNVSHPSAELVALLREAHARGVRIASICGGALVLAAAELLDGKVAATHWTTADALSERFPEVQVDASVLFADCGNVLTSAGAATGFDLCMHMVRKDFGAAVAAEAARHIVLPPQRDGGQAQFIVHPEPGPDCGSLEPTMRWIRAHLADPITLADMASYATVSPRTLNRKFREQTGTTPLQWLLRQRIQHAQELLETTTIPIEEIAQHCGFGTAINMRQHFTRQVRTSPIGYRKAFQSMGRSSSA